MLPGGAVSLHVTRIHSPFPRCSTAFNRHRLISPGHLQKLGQSLGARMLALPAGHAGIGIEACETVARAFQNQILGGGVLGAGRGVLPACRAPRYPGMHTLGGACSEGLDEALERGAGAGSAGARR